MIMFYTFLNTLNNYKISNWNLHFIHSGVNFINILHVHFSFESKLSSFSLAKFSFVIFGT